MLRSLDEGRAGIGYWISPAQRRRGYATAALRMLVGWASAIEGVERLELVVEPWNEGSWRAAEAAGFVREGLLRRWERVGGVSRDMYMYAYLPTDAPHDRDTIVSGSPAPAVAKGDETPRFVNARALDVTS